MYNLILVCVYVKACAILVVGYGLFSLPVYGFIFMLRYLVHFFQYHFFGICNTGIWYIDYDCRGGIEYFNGFNFVAKFLVFIICTIIVIVMIIKIFDLFNAYQNYRNFTKHLLQILKHLLQNGRKSLATVRDVQYRAKSEKQYPEFVLRYAFNPPDDSAPDDLIHEIVVPYDPALKPGDVLPILYTVSEDSTEVMSMPFPFPTKALPELSSCYCKTSNGVIQSS